MSLIRVLATLCASVVLCSAVSAGEIDLSFNSDAIRALYLHDFEGRDLSADVGLANNSDRGLVINASLFISGYASDGDSPLEAGVGLRGAIVDGDHSDQEGLSAAVGGFFRYALPRMDRVSIRGDLWFAPDILSIGDIEEYKDASIRLQYALLRDADIFVGARYLNAEFDNDSRQLIDSGMNVGFSIRF